jgi:hypothetical protein
VSDPIATGDAPKGGKRVINSDGVIDRLITGYVTRASARTVAVTALLFYPGLGLAVPLAFGWSTSWLISTNAMGVMLAALVALGWLLVQLEASHRRHLLEWTSDLRRLNAEEFEWLVGEVYRREGWTVKETGRQDRPDGNVDLVVTRGPDRRLVQCKRWASTQVGVGEIRGFGGTLLREGLSGVQGDFVTLSAFNEAASSEAKRIGMNLVDGRDLYERVERVRRQEPCPICQQPMAFGHSELGWWFRCVAPECRGKRDLGNEPMRAIEYLTQPDGGS